MGCFVGRGGVLQIIEGSAIGEGGYKSAQLQWGEGDALTEAAHAADATFGSRDGLVRILTELFAVDVVAGKLA